MNPLEWTDLYNLSPLVQLLLVGGLVAALPLAWVVWKGRGASERERLRLLTVATLFLTFDLVVFGAFTRLTDSGLGCPDWPGCYGHASPLGAGEHIRQAQTLMPSGPVTWSKAWIEMIHRYLAMAVGALILVAAVWAWLRRRQLCINPWWPTFTLFWVCVQGAFGAWTVTLKLFPLIVTLHLLGGLLLLVLLRMQMLRLTPSDDRPSSLGVPPAAVDAGAAHKARKWALLAWGLLWVQVMLGGWVSTNYAVLACTDFPTCQGSWWPEMNWHEAFHLWRELGESRGGESLPFAALTAIHLTHRMFAVVVSLAMLVVVAKWWQVPQQRRQALLLLALLAAQWLSGWSNAVLGWPLLAALAHTAGAAALLLVVLGLWWPRAGVGHDAQRWDPERDKP